MKLDKEEKEILAAYERGEYKTVKNSKQRIKEAVQAARNTLTKDQRVNIRLTSYDLEGVKRRALDEGIPYQTLLASIIHKFVTGKLVSKS